MKEIFTYPNNAGTDFVNPDYYGDATSGLYKRVEELRNGTYAGWNGLSPTASTSTIIQNMSKFHNYLKENWGENTIHQFWNQPLCVANFTLGAGVLSDVSLGKWYGDLRIRDRYTQQDVNFGATSFDVQETFSPLPSELAGEFQLNDTYYTDGYSIFSDVGQTTLVYDYHANSATDERIGWVNAPGIGASYGYGGHFWYSYQPIIVSRYDQGAELLLTLSDVPAYMAWDRPEYDTTKARFRAKDGAASIGMIANEPLNISTSSFRDSYTAVYDLSKYGGYTFFFDPTLTDSGVDITFTNDTGIVAYYSITNLPITPAQASTFLAKTLGEAYDPPSDTTTHYFGVCKLKITADFTYTGTSQLFVNTNPSNAHNTYWSIDVTDPLNPLLTINQLPSFVNGRNFELQPGQSITLEPYTYDVATFDSPSWMVTNVVRNENIPLTTGQVDTTVYNIDTIDIILPGNRQFSYLDAGGVSQWGARIFPNTYYLPSGLQAQMITAPDISVNLDGNGRLASFTINDGGAFGSNALEGPAYFTIAPQQSLYVPPVQTPAEQQDDWDLDPEWDTNGFNAAKEWPWEYNGGVTPSSVQMTYATPNTKTLSQSGIKYVKNLGFQRWQLQVEYPPLTEEQFRLLHVTAQNARGSYTPFYFINRDAQNNPLLLDYHTDGVTTIARPKEKAFAGDTTMLLEGFPSFQTGAVRGGELMIGGTHNGNITTMMVSNDSNAYGEVQIKIPYGFAYDYNVWNNVYFNPYHFVVTLADDGFEYSVDTFGMYYVSVTFDFDRWK